MALKVNWLATLKLWAFCSVKIPLIHWLRPRVIALNSEHAMILIPLKRRSKNHLGSMYFGALCVGADLAGGLIAMHLQRNFKEKFNIVFKDVQADFLKRPEGDVLFTCEEGAAIAQTIRTALQTGERQHVLVNILATVPDQDRFAPVAKFKLSLSIKMRKPSAKMAAKIVTPPN